MRDPMKVHDRYYHDPHFRHLVDALYATVVDAQFTPTEIREAAMFAQILYEELTLRPLLIDIVGRDDAVHS